MPIKCLLISGVPSPFQIELVEAISSNCTDLVMDVWFSSRLPLHRGLHWVSAVASSCSFFLHNPSGERDVTLAEILQISKYDIVVCGLPIHAKTVSMLHPVFNSKIPIVLWNEQPNPRNCLLASVKKILYRNVLKRINPVAIFAIGDRAVAQYKSVYNGRVHCVPYFQKLYVEKKDKIRSSCNERQRIRFLFSGRLIKRNNIQNILEASSLLITQGLSDSFEVVFFGEGEQKKNVEMMAFEYPDNIKVDSYRPKSWNDRLSPLVHSDVLLCPARHSGWGLTIPEALSLGIPVISTSKVESARYFIKDGLNGIICGESSTNVTNAMEFFLRNPENIKEMAQQCVDSSAYGDVKYGQFVFSRLLIDLSSVN